MGDGYTWIDCTKDVVATTPQEFAAALVEDFSVGPEIHDQAGH
jgi:hypothetical protein